MTRKTFRFLLAGIVLLLISLALSYLSHRPAGKTSVTNEFQRKILQAEESRDSLLNFLIGSDLLDNTDSLFSAFTNAGELLPGEDGTSLVVYRNNRLVFWSDNNITVPDVLPPGRFDKSYIYIGNGWYDVRRVSRDDIDLIGFILVERKYVHENQYLKNEIADRFNMPSITGLKLTRDGEPHTAIYNQKGEYLFSLSITHSCKRNKTLNTWTVILLLLGLICLVKAGEHFFLGEMPFVPVGKILLFSFLIFVLRVVMIQFHIPSMFYKTALFDPTFYAHSYFFSSAGDLFINAILLLYFVYLLNRSKTSRLIVNPRFRGNRRYIFLVLATLLQLGSGFFIIHIVKGGVQNSTINFDVSDIFKLSYFSYLGMFAFGLLFFAFLVGVNKINEILLQMDIRPHVIAITYTVASLLAFLSVYSMLPDWYTAFESLWTLPIVVSITYFKTPVRKNYSFSMLVLLVLLFAAAASVIIVQGGSNREMNERRYLAGKLSTNTDPVAEYLFDEQRKLIARDTLVARLILNYWANEQQIRQHLMQRYFNGYWDKYDFEFVGCSLEDSILISPQNLSDHCLSYFELKMMNETEQTSYNNLFHVPNNNAIASYLGRVKIQYTNNELAYLFVEFRSKPFIKNEGYPELLLGQKEIDRTLDLENYSFAQYQDGQLVNSLGDYHYQMIFNSDRQDRYKVFNEDGYSHLSYNADDNTTILLSRKINKPIQGTILFSFLFSMFSVLFFTFGIAIADFPLHYSFSFLSFGSKLQLILVGVILIIIIPFGVGVTYYIKKHYQERNERNLTEKLRSVLTEIEHKIGNEEFLPTEMPSYFSDYLNQILIKFSNVFYTDINLYGLDGQLLATSRSEVFDIGLKSKQMDVDAYREMILKRKSLYIHTEKIGELSYLSAYVPFRNNENELLAYLNLPYFAKQNELEQELGGFLIALANSYIFLMALAIIMAVVFADYLSRPLKLISSKISQLKLGSENELIQWEGDDEIGVLVDEYNRMVMELAKNVELLARSEREGAWREMAKQVAHEIKNPLTPMKLSVQHLKRAFDANAANIHEQVNKVSNTLVEQIDSLTRIADEFSNFAKMPAARKERLNIREVLESSINLFKEEHIRINLNADSDIDNYQVEADRDQLMRAFNNLIKNAIQAIPEDKEGRIDIIIQHIRGNIRVQIKDNGKGISDEERQKIFAPNFTTKSGGMGLGLAMVKNVIEHSQGTVSFESVFGEGTVFYIELPVVS